MAYLKRIRLARNTVDDFTAYPFSLPLIKSLNTVEFDSPVTFFVGANGAGKSTLLEAIAVALGFNAEGGSRNFNFTTRASHSNLHTHLDLARGTRKPRTGYFLRAESFFNVATEVDHLGSDILTAAYGGRSLHEQSHGESFLTLMLDRFTNNGLYLLDEPEAALSPTSQLAALARIHDLVRQGSQFLIATHSPILMAYPGATIYACTDSGINPVAYQDTDHYRITRDFLQAPNNSCTNCSTQTHRARNQQTQQRTKQASTTAQVSPKWPALTAILALSVPEALRDGPP